MLADQSLQLNIFWGVGRSELEELLERDLRLAALVCCVGRVSSDLMHAMAWLQ